MAALLQRTLTGRDVILLVFSSVPFNQLYLAGQMQPPLPVRRYLEPGG
jgi:hypothetical protein